MRTSSMRTAAGCSSMSRFARIWASVAMPVTPEWRIISGPRVVLAVALVVLVAPVEHLAVLAEHQAAQAVVLVAQAVVPAALVVQADPEEA